MHAWHAHYQASHALHIHSHAACMPWTITYMCACQLTLRLSACPHTTGAGVYLVCLYLAQDISSCNLLPFFLFPGRDITLHARAHMH